MNWEIGIDVSTRPCVRQTASGKEDAVWHREQPGALG